MWSWCVLEPYQTGRYRHQLQQVLQIQSDSPLLLLLQDNQMAAATTVPLFQEKVTPHTLPWCSLWQRS